MASLTVYRPDLFPAGTFVSAYEALSHESTPAPGRPPGPVASSATAGSTSVTFSGLDEGTAYWLHATGPDRYLRATTEPSALAAGGGSILFGQGDSSLATSLPWRAPSPVTFGRATVTVAAAVSGNVDLVAVKVNGVTATTLSLSTGQTTNTTTVDMNVSAGDLLTVTRLDASGGACQVQLDRSA